MLQDLYLIANHHFSRCLLMKANISCHLGSTPKKYVPFGLQKWFAWKLCEKRHFWILGHWIEFKHPHFNVSCHFPVLNNYKLNALFTHTSRMINSPLTRIKAFYTFKLPFKMQWNAVFMFSFIHTKNLSLCKFHSY